MKKTHSILLALALVAGAHKSSASTVTLETLSLGNPGSDGSTQYGASGTYYWNGSAGGGSFAAQGATLVNNYDSLYDSWDGFAYSNTVDTTTAGYGNQYSAIAGGGAGGSSIYAVGYQPFSGLWSMTLGSAENFSGRGIFVTNTTYAGLDMRDGSGFSKKFGGATGNDTDWFKLTIQGWNGGSSVGSADFYLADYRFSDNSRDYIVDSWAFVDLSSLGAVDKLTFGLTSSDNSFGYMNTPAYFALDNVGAVPEPNTYGLLAIAALLGAWMKRRRKITG
jgi:hypothetical protein